MNLYSLFFLSVLVSAACSLNAGLEDHFKPCPNKVCHHSLKNIDFVYVINLDKRPDRWEDCTDRLKPFGISPYRFSAVNGWELPIEVINDVGLKYEPWMKSNIMGTYYYLDENQKIQHAHEPIHVVGRTYFCHCLAKGPIAIALSHLSVLQDAWDSGYKTIWVMEDDIEIIRDPNLIPAMIDRLDALVGKEGWDILFTDRDMRKENGEYNPCYWCSARPNFTPWNTQAFAQRQTISPDFQKIGARFGAHSMIIRRPGIKKLLDFFKTYHIFLPYDLDFIFPSGIDWDIALYSVLQDIVSNQVDSVSDNGSPSYDH